MKNQRDLRRLPTVFLTVLTLLLAIALCWAAADIWLRGSLRRSADPAAVIYSVEAVRTWAIRILPVFLLWLLSLAPRNKSVAAGGSACLLCPQWGGFAALYLPLPSC